MGQLRKTVVIHNDDLNFLKTHVRGCLHGEVGGAEGQTYAGHRALPWWRFQLALRSLSTCAKTAVLPGRPYKHLMRRPTSSQHKPSNITPDVWRTLPHKDMLLSCVYILWKCMVLKWHEDLLLIRETVNNKTVFVTILNITSISMVSLWTCQFCFHRL